MSRFKSKVVLTYPTDVVYAAAIHLKWILADTCFDYLLAHLLGFTGAVVELLETQKTIIIDQKTMELIGFDDSVYSLPTFLFDVGYRKLESIIDILHFLRTLTLPRPSNLATAFILQTKLRKFIEENTYLHNRETDFETNPMTANRDKLEKMCLEIKTKIINVSEIFFLYITPLINTIIYDRKFEDEHTNQLSAFRKYIYETEKFTIDVSIMIVFLLYYNIKS